MMFLEEEGGGEGGGGAGGGGGGGGGRTTLCLSRIDFAHGGENGGTFFSQPARNQVRENFQKLKISNKYFFLPDVKFSLHPV